jgi:undecaprenyl-diphosphatase
MSAVAGAVVPANLTVQTRIRLMSPLPILMWCLVAASNGDGAGIAPGIATSPKGEPSAQIAKAHSEPPRLTLGRSIVLGIVEGVTEYLPVSSTGHLILAQRAMGIENSGAANAYAICIQFGAICAVLGLYRRRVREMVWGVFGRGEPGRRTAWNLVAAFLPAAVFGLMFDKTIERHLFGLRPVVIAWFVGGVAILVVAWHRRGRSPHEGDALEQLSWRGAVWIGLVQCLAMWPGTSRSLVTIVGGVMVGLSVPAAVEFSFLLGVVTLGAATGYKAHTHAPLMFETYGWANLLLGFLAATVSAVAAVKWMVSYLNRHGMAVFGYYRLVLAALVATLLMTGAL